MNSQPVCCVSLQKGPKSMLSVQASAEPSRGGSSTRPMLRFEDR